MNDGQSDKNFVLKTLIYFQPCPQMRLNCSIFKHYSTIEVYKEFKKLNLLKNQNYFTVLSSGTVFLDPQP